LSIILGSYNETVVQLCTVKCIDNSLGDENDPLEPSLGVSAGEVEEYVAINFASLEEAESLLCDDNKFEVLPCPIKQSVVPINKMQGKANARTAKNAPEKFFIASYIIYDVRCDRIECLLR